MKIKTIILTLSMCLSTSAMADHCTTQLQELFKNTPNFQANFIQQLNGTESKGLIVMQQTPAKVRWETTSPTAQVNIVTSDKLQQYVPDLQQVVIMAPQKIGQGPAEILSGSQKALEIYNITCSAGNQYTMTPKDLENGSPVVNLIFSKVDQAGPEVLKKMIISPGSANSSEITFSKRQVSESVDPSAFVLSDLPKDVEIDNELHAQQA